MTVFTAIRYRNDMSIFDHYHDGIICDGTTDKSNLAPALDANKDFSIAQVDILVVCRFIINVLY